MNIDYSEFHPSLNMTFILLFLLFVTSLIYIRLSHCSCGMYKSKCKCNNKNRNDNTNYDSRYDIYEGASGSVGQSAFSLTPYQSQIPIEVERQQTSTIPKPQEPITLPATLPTTIGQTTNVPITSPAVNTTKTNTSENATNVPQSTRSQKANIEKPKFNWSTDPKVNEELRQQVMKDIEITKQKDINIIQTKPGTIKNVQITPDHPTTPEIPTTIQQTPPQPAKKSMTGWILIGVFGGIWCLMVTIITIVLLVKYRSNV